ncbi:O-antigen ligase [Devosia sp. 2618]|uniref:O-antigen ligase family protein n=1 Tax=Devosia sp. 2618 TaxID=3156454 RepID=UPI00339740C0
MPKAASVRGKSPITFGGFIALMILAFFWIGTQPFVDLTSTESSYNPISQVIILVLTILAIGQGLRIKSPINWSHYTPVGMLFVWLLFSALAADDTALALRNSIIQALFMINALLLTILPRTQSEFARVTCIAVLLALVLSYFGVVFLPGLSIHQTGDIFEPMLAGLWRGHYMHKNAASAAMVITIFFAIYCYSNGSRVLALLLAIGAGFFLIHTGGKTSLATLPAILVLAWMVEKFAWIRIPLIVGGLLVFNFITIGSAFSPGIYDFIASLGIDPTFTNRIDIWRIAMRVASESPITGVGLHTFWGSYPVLYGGGHIETWAYSAGSAHNGYLDVAMNIGIPGLLLVVYIFILRPIRHIQPALDSGNDTALTRLFLRIWLFVLVGSCLESQFFARGGVHWFLFMAAVFGLQFQAKARLVPAPSKQINPGAMSVHA